MARTGVPPRVFWQNSNCNPWMTFALYIHLGPKCLESLDLARHHLLNNSPYFQQRNKQYVVSLDCAINTDRRILEFYGCSHSFCTSLTMPSLNLQDLNLQIMAMVVVLGPGRSYGRPKYSNDVLIMNKIERDNTHVCCTMKSWRSGGDYDRHN